MLSWLKKWYHRNKAQVGDVYELTDGEGEYKLKVVRVAGYGPNDFVHFSDHTHMKQKHLRPEMRQPRLTYGCSIEEDEDKEVKAPTNKQVTNFKRIHTTDSTTLVCECGQQFIWTGIDDGLAPWVGQHMSHGK